MGVAGHPIHPPGSISEIRLAISSSSAAASINIITVAMRSLINSY